MQNINTNDIVTNIEAQGIKVISIEYSNFKSIQLKGNLQNFIDATKAFNENVIFFEDFSFNENDFFYEPDGPVLGEYDVPPSDDGIDLTQFLPAMKEYKSYLGQTSLLIFQVFYKNHVFAYWHNAEWFEAFTKLFKEAQGIFEEREKTVKDQQVQHLNAAREEIEQRENYLRGLLKELATDDKFILLKTQKAQQEYALARYPELTELSQPLLKDEISNLNARIQARKLLQQ